ncbi:MAG: PAC2 family protein [Methanotrichaceae archaeon]
MTWKIFGSRVCVGGLPGTGNVGKVATDCISTALECHTLKAVISPGFPPQVMVIDGMVRVLQVELKAPERREDLLVLSSDAQPLTPTKMYGLAGKILKTLKSFDVTDLITLAAYVSRSEETIFGVATDRYLAQELEQEGVILLHDGIIGGLNGILVGLCPFYDMRGVCLMGNTTGEDPVDLVAAKNLIEATKHILHLDLSVDGLDLEEVSVEGISRDITETERSDDDGFYVAYR